MKGLEFSKGMTVEVNLCKYVWFQAVILEEDGFNSFWVKINRPRNNKESEKKVLVDSFHIRPPQPFIKTTEFELLDKVCVFHGSARKEGFITNILTDGSYVVYLKAEKMTKKFHESKLMLYLQLVNGKWTGRHCKDGLLISSGQGQSDIFVNKERSPSVTVKLDSASSMNTLVLEQSPCTNSYANQLNDLTASNSKFRKARSKTCRRKATNTSPCKFKWEKSVELSFFSECHEKSTPPTPLEQSNGENSTNCMLAKCSSNPVAENRASVESTIPVSRKETREDEAMMEDNMMTFVEKSEAPLNSELKCQQVSASGTRVYTNNVCLETFAPPSSIDHMETDYLLNICGSEFVDQPQLIHSEGGEDNGKGVLGETLAPTDCMEEEVNMDASLISFCQGKSDDLVGNKERETDVAIQPESASVLNNTCENPLNYSAILNPEFMGAKRRTCKRKAESSSPCKNSCENPSNYSATLNSEFMNAKCRAYKSKSESSSPCKKFRGEKYATRSSSAECHQNSTALEQLNGEKITSCMLPQCSSNPVIDNFLSVESTSPINSGVHEEATMEAYMMTSEEKSRAPENSEHKGEKDNSKVVLEEMLTPQFSTDYMAEEVNMLDVGTNCVVKSGGMLMDDECLLLCSEETSSPLVTRHCMEKIVTDYVAAECISESCGTSNVDQRSQLLCLEGGKNNRKIESAETSTTLSATDCMTKEAEIVEITKDCVENCNEKSSVHQPEFLFLEGRSPDNTHNQCNYTIDGQSVPGTESPVRSVGVNDEPVENVEMPFVKNPNLWKFADSLEIFKLVPQKPHFHPLMNVREPFREGFAIGYMMTFSSVVEKITELQVTDSENKLNNYLETLAELELHGFRVKPMVDRVNKLLSIKDELRQFEDQTKEVKVQLAGRICERVKLNACKFAIDKVIREWRKELGLYVLLEKNCSRDITNLQQDDSAVDEGISDAIRGFEDLVAASW